MNISDGSRWCPIIKSVGNVRRSLIVVQVKLIIYVELKTDQQLRSLYSRSPI